MRMPALAGSSLYVMVEEGLTSSKRGMTFCHA
jgi:hypothetical protein